MSSIGDSFISMLEVYMAGDSKDFAGFLCEQYLTIEEQRVSLYELLLDPYRYRGFVIAFFNGTDKEGISPFQFCITLDAVEVVDYGWDVAIKVIISASSPPVDSGIRDLVLFGAGVSNDKILCKIDNWKEEMRGCPARISMQKQHDDLIIREIVDFLLKSHICDESADVKGKGKSKDDDHRQDFVSFCDSILTSDGISYSALESIYRSQESSISYFKECVLKALLPLASEKLTHRRGDIDEFMSTFTLKSWFGDNGKRYGTTAKESIESLSDMLRFRLIYYLAKKSVDSKYNKVVARLAVVAAASRTESNLTFFSSSPLLDPSPAKLKECLINTANEYIVWIDSGCPRLNNDDYQPGFFASWRHGSFGKHRAKEFVNKVQQASDDQVLEVWKILSDHLNDGASRRNNHSLDTDLLHALFADQAIRFFVMKMIKDVEGGEREGRSCYYRSELSGYIIASSSSEMSLGY